MLILSSKPVEFTPEAEKGKEKPVTFMVTPPTREVILKMQDLLQDSIVKSPNAQDPDSLTQTFRFSEYARVLLDECVVGWKNIFTKDEKGNLIDLPFTKENLKYLSDINMLNELITFIDSLSSLGK